MAIDSYLYLTESNGSQLNGESTFQASSVKFPPGVVAPTGRPVQLTTWAAEADNTVNIGSSGGGSGAGKVTFQPFSFTKSVDVTSPVLFEMTANGTHFKQLTLLVVKSSGTGGASLAVEYKFDLVYLKSIMWTPGDTAVQEDVTVVFGGLEVTYAVQNPNGSYGTAQTSTWNIVNNTPNPPPGS